jgi:hypothetical protein
MVARWSHRGHRRRSEVIRSRLYPGYALFRRAVPLQIASKPKDRQCTPFIVAYDVRRELRGKNRKEQWGKCLKLRPVVDRFRRGDLKLKLGPHGAIFYHRLVALEVCPCTTDKRGTEVDPFFVVFHQAKAFEVHHATAKDTHDCRPGNLFVLYREHHRSLLKGSRA